MKIIATMILLLTAPAFAGWTDPVRISEPGGCWYPQILAQGDTLHAVFMHWEVGRGIGYVRSTDCGENWGGEIELSDVENTEAPQFPRIISYNQKLIAIWKAYFIHGVRHYNIGYSISDDNGQTWAVPAYILGSNWEHILYFAASGSGPVVNIILSSRRDEDLVFYSLRSTDFGESWSNPVEIFRAYQSDLTDGAAHDSVFHFSWGGRFEQWPPWEVRYMRSTDWGITWSENILMSDADEHKSYETSIFANHDNSVQLAWTEFKYSPYWFTGDIFLRQSPDEGTYWIPEDQLTFHHLVNRSDVVSKSDTIHIAWYDQRPENGATSIYCIASTDGGLSWSEEYRLDQDESQSRHPALASSNGRVYVIWADDRSYPPADIYPGIYFRRHEEGTSIKPEWWLSPEESANVPQAVSISAYPNPFNSTTIISYANLDNSDGINIVNVLGQMVKTFNIQNRKEGQVVWDGTDTGGNPVASGVYLIKATALPDSQGLKLLYLK